jgi:histidinol-phosphate aminotransferase
MRRALRPATHGGPDGSESPPLDFSACANAYGPAPIVRDAIASAPIDRYPDPTSTATRRAASARWNRPIDELAFGAGSVELLYATMLAVVKPSDTVLIPRPAFGEYGRAALLAGARIHRPRRLPLGSAPDAIVSAFIEAIDAKHPRVAVLATPTSPDGTMLSAAHVRAVADICARTNTLLVLDQAYDAFVASPLGIPASSTVLHLRSLTKEHALPGLRVGFAIGPAPLISAIEGCRPPWMASTIAQAAAIAAFSDAAESHVAHTVTRLRDASLALATWCRNHGIPVIPSETHYQLAQIGNAHDLRAIGIGVRDCTSFGLPRYVRIAARTDPEMTALRAALLQVSRR